MEFKPGGCTAHLRANPFLGGWRALFCGEVFVWSPDSTQGWSVFDRRRIWDIIFQEGYKRFVMSYVINITVDYYFPEARLGREKTARGYRSGEDKYICQGTPWDDELDGKELHGAAR